MYVYIVCSPHVLHNKAPKPCPKPYSSVHFLFFSIIPLQATYIPYIILSFIGFVLENIDTLRTKAGALVTNILSQVSYRLFVGLRIQGLGFRVEN